MSDNAVPELQTRPGETTRGGSRHYATYSHGTPAATMSNHKDSAGQRCVFCGHLVSSYTPVDGISAHDVDCMVCGRYRVSEDRESRILRRQFSRRTRAAYLSAIRSSNAEGRRYSIDDGRSLT